MGVGKFLFLVDFVVLDMEEDTQIPIILGQVNLTVRDDKVTFSWPML